MDRETDAGQSDLYKLLCQVQVTQGLIKPPKAIYSVFFSISILSFQTSWQ